MSSERWRPFCLGLILLISIPDDESSSASPGRLSSQYAHSVISFSSQYDNSGYVMITSSVIKWKHFPLYWPFAGNSPVTGEYPSQRPVKRSFDFFLWSAPYKTVKQTFKRFPPRIYNNARNLNHVCPFLCNIVDILIKIYLNYIKLGTQIIIWN